MERKRQTKHKGQMEVLFQSLLTETKDGSKMCRKKCGNSRQVGKSEYCLQNFYICTLHSPSHSYSSHTHTLSTPKLSAQIRHRSREKVLHPFVGRDRNTMFDMLLGQNV